MDSVAFVYVLVFVVYVCVYLYVKTKIIKDNMKFRDHRGHGKNQRGAGRNKNDINTVLPYKFLRVYII